MEQEMGGREGLYMELGVRAGGWRWWGKFLTRNITPIVAPGSASITHVALSALVVSLLSTTDYYSGFRKLFSPRFSLSLAIDRK